MFLQIKLNDKWKIIIQNIQIISILYIDIHVQKESLK